MSIIQPVVTSWHLHEVKKLFHDANEIACKAVFLNGEWRLSHMVRLPFTHLVTMDQICVGDIKAERKRSESQAEAWLSRFRKFSDEIAERVVQ
jgi:hypothetical protein